MSDFRRPAQSRRRPLPGLNAHLLDWPGDAPPVVLLHPNRTNARVWDFMVDASRLANRFLAPDARGHGLSDYPETGYGYEDYLADLRALLMAEGLARVHLVGAATGGNLALLLASQAPELVASLTVVDPGVSLDPQLSARVREQMVREFRFDSLAEARSRMPFSHLWSEAMKNHYSRHSFVEEADGRFAWRYHPPGAVATEHLLETPIWDRIRVTCPTLIVRGSASEVFPRANMQRLAALIPAAQCAEVQADHRVPQDNPAALAALLDDFIGAQ
ncbi:MAG: alpha/beta hydrolase [Burkholderiales bacterium]|nr:alpha/beta hydrolase [Burkholderiales bacterium]